MKCLTQTGVRRFDEGSGENACHLSSLLFLSRGTYCKEWRGHSFTVVSLISFESTQLFPFLMYFALISVFMSVGVHLLSLRLKAENQGRRMNKSCTEIDVRQ